MMEFFIAFAVPFCFSGDSSASDRPGRGRSIACRF